MSQEYSNDGNLLCEMLKGCIKTNGRTLVNGL